MPKGLLILIVPIAGAFFLLVGFIAIDFVRVRAGALPGEAPGLATYLSTAGGRTEPEARAERVAAIGVTPGAEPPAERGVPEAVAAAETPANGSPAVEIDVAKAGASSSGFSFNRKAQAHEEIVTFSCSTDQIGVKRCVSDIRK